MVGFRDARKVTEARIDIHMRDRLIVTKSGFAQAGQHDHKGDTGGVSPDGSLAPVSFLTKVPTCLLYTSPSPRDS